MFTIITDYTRAARRLQYKMGYTKIEEMNSNIVGYTRWLPTAHDNPEKGVATS